MNQVIQVDTVRTDRTSDHESDVRCLDGRDGVRVVHFARCAMLAVAVIERFEIGFWQCVGKEVRRK